MPADLKSLFLLDPDVHFLNHGSFGAVPRSVLRDWQAWQRRIELQPVRFLARELPQHLALVRERLGAEFGATADDFLLVANVTFAVNLVARSLELAPGDEILASDHEYGACDLIWETVCAARGAHYRRCSLPLSASPEEPLAEIFWRAVTPRTRLVFLSQITSPTALRLPVESICRKARASGILSLIDGAHVPGQVPLDLGALDADLYVGNLHKWCLAPRGAAFLHARKSCQALLEPLVVSWGRRPGDADTLAARMQWTGTTDPSAFLAVPAALDFQQRNAWPTVRQACHELLTHSLMRIADLTGLAPAYPLGSDRYAQMGIAPLPEGTHAANLQRQLYQEFQVEVPLIEWSGRTYLRISIQAYNDATDIAALLEGLARLLPRR